MKEWKLFILESVGYPNNLTTQNACLQIFIPLLFFKKRFISIKQPIYRIVTKQFDDQ